MILPLFSGLVRAHLEWCVGVSRSELPSTRETGAYWHESNGGPQKWWMNWGTCHEERLREPGIFSLKKRELKGIMSVCIHTWWGQAKKAEMDSVVPSNRTGGKGHKLKCREFHVIVGVTRPRELVESLLLEIFTNLTGQGLEQPPWGDLALSRKVGLGNM